MKLILSTCPNCGYVGNIGKWKGKAVIRVRKEPKEEKELEGIVMLGEKDSSFDEVWKPDILIDNAIEKGILTEEEADNIKSFDGKVYCPVCNKTELEL